MKHNKQPGGTIIIQVENYCGYKLPSTDGDGNASVYLGGTCSQVLQEQA